MQKREREPFPMFQPIAPSAAPSAARRVGSLSSRQHRKALQCQKRMATYHAALCGAEEGSAVILTVGLLMLVGMQLLVMSALTTGSLTDEAVYQTQHIHARDEANQVLNELQNQLRRAHNTLLKFDKNVVNAKLQAASSRTWCTTEGWGGSDTSWCTKTFQNVRPQLYDTTTNTYIQSPYTINTTIDVTNAPNYVLKATATGLGMNLEVRRNLRLANKQVVYDVLHAIHQGLQTAYNERATLGVGRMATSQVIKPVLSYSQWCDSNAQASGCWNTLEQGTANWDAISQDPKKGNTGESDLDAGGALLTNGTTIMGVQDNHARLAGAYKGIDRSHIGADSIYLDFNGVFPPNEINKDQMQLLLCENNSVQSVPGFCGIDYYYNDMNCWAGPNFTGDRGGPDQSYYSVAKYAAAPYVTAHGAGFGWGMAPRNTSETLFDQGWVNGNY